MNSIKTSGLASIGLVVLVGLSCMTNDHQTVSDPFFTLSADTTLLANDTARARILTPGGNRRTVIYSWYLDGKTSAVQSSLDTQCTFVFGIRDTGIHTVEVDGRDYQSGGRSRSGTMKITVRPGVPLVAAEADSTIWVGDTLRLHAQGLDSNGTIRSFRWTFAGRGIDTLTDTGLLVLPVTLHDTAGLVAVVRAVDNDGLASRPDTLRTKVLESIPLLAALRDTVVHIGDTLHIHALVTSSHATVVRYTWKKDSLVLSGIDSANASFVISARDTGIVHRVEVRALDADSLWSVPVAMTFSVAFGHPVLSVMHDTTIAVNDPLVLRAWPADSETLFTNYSWSIDSGEQIRTTRSGTTSISWPVSDTGIHRIVVFASQSDSIRSNIDTIRITVKAFAPTVSAMADTTIAINDTVGVRAVGVDTNGWIAHYLWTIDTNTIADTTTLGLLAVHWGVGDTGVHLVRVAVVDNDNLESRVDTIRVTVKAFPPVLTLRDTLTTYAGDTVTVTFSAHGTDGKIVKYLWEFEGANVSDSSLVPRIPVYSVGLDSMYVRVTVRDEDGLTAQKRILIRFSQNPVNVQLVNPHQDTLAVLPYDLWQAGSAPVYFQFRGYDSSHAAGRLTYALFLSPQPSTFGTTPVFSGLDSLCSITGLNEGRYYWKLKAANTRGDSAKAYGSFNVMIQRRVCFIGHSIVVGLGCDAGTGGFRAQVLDSLRAGYPQQESFKAVGPITTNTYYNTTYMLPSEDDSCLAISGTQAIDILSDLMYAPSLSADIWVLMIGTNGLTRSDPYYTPILIDSMHARNPHAYMYVLNAPMLDPSVYAQNFFDGLYNFNSQMVSDVAERRSKGWNIFLVDDFSALSPDSVFPSALMSDAVHPNQAGYNLIGDAIMKVVRPTLPPAPAP